MKTTVAVDMDGVLANLMGYTRGLAALSDDAVVRAFDFDQIRSHGFLHDPTTPDPVVKFVRKLWNTPKTWTRLPPLPLVSALVESQDKLNIVVVTSPWSINGKIGPCVDAKREWLHTHGFRAEVGLIFTTHVGRGGIPIKSLIQADAFIDDYADVALRFKAAQPSAAVWVPKRMSNLAHHAELVANGIFHVDDEDIVRAIKKTAHV